MTTYSILPVHSNCVWQRATYGGALALWASYNGSGLPARLLLVPMKGRA